MIKVLSPKNFDTQWVFLYFEFETCYENFKIVNFILNSSSIHYRIKIN